MRKELTEAKADFISSIKPKDIKIGGFSKNVLRPIYVDGSNVESGKMCKACATWPTAYGTNS